MGPKKILKALILVVVIAVTLAGEDGVDKKGDLPQVEIEVIVGPSEAGCSRKSKAKDVLKVHFDGYLQDGTKFDSSRESGADPIMVQLGSKTVLKGWDIGLIDMCVGEKRKLTIPPRFAYGSQGRGGVPGKATVIFEVELYDIQGGIHLSDAFSRLDLDMDGFIDTNEFEDQLKAASKTKEFPIPEDEFMVRQIVQMAFQAGDKDRDGLLSEKELGKIPGLRNIFSRKDEL
ncbi:FK506-binding protein 2-like [Pecten maximus]|uniref:FK506-binding protein 2-like n=1 Tax=Pecten maximus TaxID=6579 RepID=UPI001458B4D7|nr:FK506-binding protein 2-like [Pecten maximus]